MTVRLATAADEAQLMAICRELHLENGLASFDEEMVREMLHRTFEKRGGIIGVIDGPKEIEAAIFLLLSTLWYSHDYHIEELFNYVRVPYRGTSHSTDLVAFAQNSAKTLCLPLVIGIFTNRQLDAKVRLYRRKLGEPSGAVFIYNATWANEETNPVAWSVMSGKQERIPQGARYISQATLAQLGDGDPNRGWSVIDKFIKRKLPKGNGSMAELLPALTTAVMTTTPLPVMPLAANG